MLAAPSRDWNVFKQIFAEHWDGFTHAHPRYRRPTTTAGGQDAWVWQPGKMGLSNTAACSVARGGSGVDELSIVLVLAVRQSSVDNWVSQGSEVLHQGVIYRHIILTVPAMFHITFYHNAALLLSALMRCGVQCLDEFYSAVRGQALQGRMAAPIRARGAPGQRPGRPAPTWPGLA